jgi:hypothetical protein
MMIGQKLQGVLPHRDSLWILRAGSGTEEEGRKTKNSRDFLSVSSLCGEKLVPPPSYHNAGSAKGLANSAKAVRIQAWRI